MSLPADPLEPQNGAIAIIRDPSCTMQEIELMLARIMGVPSSQA
jgi:hypothetical protein